MAPSDDFVVGLRTSAKVFVKPCTLLKISSDMHLKLFVCPYRVAWEMEQVIRSPVSSLSVCVCLYPPSLDRKLYLFFDKTWHRRVAS